MQTVGGSVDQGSSLWEKEADEYRRTTTDKSKVGQNNPQRPQSSEAKQESLRPLLFLTSCDTGTCVEMVLEPKRVQLKTQLKLLKTC